MATKKKPGTKAPAEKPAARSDTRSAASSDAGAVDTVSFDLRRNLIHILGEEHYPHAEYLYHELASNAWDEDATEVRIVEETVQPAARGRAATYNIRVTDDGNGMDFVGLREYFTVGESSKPGRETTERLGRRLIGQIGVGKVAILKVARKWTVTTERNLELSEKPVRLRVHVDIDEWISGQVPNFAVQYLEPTGQQGTELVLEGAQIRMRSDRIMRHIQRLPLGENFMVWRNGEPIRPREWSGVDMVKIDEDVEWEQKGTKSTGHLTGEIWLRSEDLSRTERAFIEEPKEEEAGLNRVPAGIEVRVNGDMVAREFFGHETHGHGVNRIWGWVEAPWLPITGNRTDYLRDSPAGHVFYEAVKEHYDAVFNSIRYEKEKRTRNKNGSKKNAGDKKEKKSEKRTTEVVAERYGEVINEILSDKPEFSPVLEEEARRGRGRPSASRIYPVRPTGRREAFEADPQGDVYGLTTAIGGEVPSVEPRADEPHGGAELRQPHQGRVVDNGGHSVAEIGERVVNTKAGVRLRFEALGKLEAPHRWNFDDLDDLTLDVNTDHKLYDDAGEPGGRQHRFYCAWIVSLALAERLLPMSGSHLADYMEHLCYELYDGWGSRA